MPIKDKKLSYPIAFLLDKLLRDASMFSKTLEKAA
jgi:hypothetical protein